MKTITLKQPWATLVAEEIKKYEFRSWKTNYRGKILIHAGAGIEKNEMKTFEDLDLEYPSQRIIAEAELVDCIELDDELNDKIIAEKNIAYGSKRRTGFAWKLEKIRKINSDDIVSGQLGLWNYDLKN